MNSTFTLTGNGSGLENSCSFVFIRVHSCSFVVGKVFSGSTAGFALNL